MTNLYYREQYIDGVIDGLSKLSFGFGVKFIFMEKVCNKLFTNYYVIVII